MVHQRTYVLENTWSINELQVIINRLSDKIDDTHKGEKRMCKEQGQGRGGRRDSDDHDGRGGDGRKRSDRNVSREKFLALPAPPSSLTSRHEKSQSRGRKKSVSLKGFCAALQERENPSRNQFINSVPTPLSLSLRVLLAGRQRTGQRWRGSPAAANGRWQLRWCLHLLRGADGVGGSTRDRLVTANNSKSTELDGSG
nr:hypothetical protein Iba_scaffold11966CG0010 [Ipomoea batatas]